MSHEHHHHHHHHQESSELAAGYASAQPPVESPYVDVAPESYGHGYGERPQQEEDHSRLEALREEEKKHKRHEHMGEFGGLAATAFAMYEKHEMKVDPEHAHRHKLEEETAAAVAVGSGGYTLYEHHEVKKEEHLGEQLEGKKHHHHLF